MKLSLERFLCFYTDHWRGKYPNLSLFSKGFQISCTIKKQGNSTKLKSGGRKYRGDLCLRRPTITLPSSVIRKKIQLYNGCISCLHVSKSWKTNATFICIYSLMYKIRRGSLPTPQNYYMIVPFWNLSDNWPVSMQIQQTPGYTSETFSKKQIINSL